VVKVETAAPAWKPSALEGNPFMEKRQLIGAIRQEMRTLAGRDYHLDLGPLDIPSLRELLRLLRDIEDEQQTAINRARQMPWRRS
jgi:hypothetical protein